MPDAAPYDPVASAKALAPQIRAAREEMDELRRLPDHLVQALDQAGFLQMNLPKSLDGQEMDPVTSFLVIEELSKTDGSVGWCSFLSSGTSLLLGWLTTKAALQMVGSPPRFRGAGSLRPEGEAVCEDGGYRVTGRWDFGSGIDHANWLICTCRVVNADGPVLRPNGVQDTRTLFVPKDCAAVHDVWNVLGMRGTGSNDFTLENVFVPVEQTFSVDDEPYETGPLFNRRLVIVNIWSTNAANALGIARTAMDAFIEMASQSSSTRSAALLRDRAPIQLAVGQAEAIIGAARAYVLDTTGAAWEAVSSGIPDPGPQIAQARLAITHAIQESVKAVDLLFHAAGTNAIHESQPLEQRFRDVHVAVTHIAGLSQNMEMAGQYLMGLDPGATGW